MTENNTPSPKDTTHKPEGGFLSGSFRFVRRLLVHLASFSLAINLLVLAVPVFMIQVFDRVLASHSHETLTVLAVGAVAALAVMAALDAVRTRILIRAGFRLEQDLGPKLAASFRHDRLSDLSRLKQFLAGNGVMTLLDAPWAPLFLAIIFMLHPTLGWIALGGAAILLATAVAAEMWLRGPMVDALQTDAQVRDLNRALSHCGHAGTALGMGDALAGRWQHLQNGNWSHQIKAADRAAVAGVFGRFVRLTLQIALMATAASLVIGNEITAGAMIAASVILSRALAPFERAIDLWRALVLARASLARLSQGNSNIEPDGIALPADADPVLEARRAAVFPGPAAEPVFAGLSFKVKGGEMLGITGPSGSGKSTLGRLLIGLASPDQGRVLLNGSDAVRRFGAGLGGDIGYVGQTPDLIPGSILDNIRRFTDAPLEDVFDAAARAGVHNQILELPLGYETAVGGDQNALPAGFVQRIALARAFFGSPKILVLDEPYTHLDNDGVSSLLSHFENQRSGGAAIVVISQRPSVLAHCKRVLVLRDGRGRIVGRRRKADLRLLSGETAPEVSPSKREDGAHKESARLQSIGAQK